ncbi:hypothetical protein YQE_09385, partial [Dendroctonus ponderosae]
MAENHLNLLKNQQENHEFSDMDYESYKHQVRSSLPNDMNGSETREFIGEAVKQQKMNELALIPSSPEEIPQDDLSARDYEERLIDEGECSQEVGLSPAENLLISTATKYTTQATIHIQSHRASNVDDPLALTGLDGSAVERKPVDSSMLGKVIQHNKGLINLKTTNIEERIQGHRSEIIDDVDELLHYIEGTTDNMKSRTIQSKSKQVHKQHPPDDAGSRVGKKKQFKSVSKDSDNNLEAEILAARVGHDRIHLQVECLLLAAMRIEDPDEPPLLIWEL